MTEPRQSFETISGCKVNLRRAGKGEPLLFLHGAQGAPLWLPFMAELAQRFEVIVPEHPGFGLSENPDWLDNIADVAFFYLDFMAALGLKRVNLLGTSLGGWIAAEIAVRDQGPLKTLILVAPSGIHVKGLQPADIFLWSREQAIRNLVADPALAEKMLSQPPTEAQIDLMLKNNITVAKLAWQPRLYNPHLYKWLHRITVPTLILWGDNDKLMPPAYGPEFQKLISGSKLQVFKNCGHLPHIEKTEEYVAAVTKFVEGARP